MSELLYYKMKKKIIVCPQEKHEIVTYNRTIYFFKVVVDHFIKNGHLKLFERFIVCVISVFKIKECD